MPTGRWRAAIFSTTLAALLLTGASAAVNGQRKPAPRPGASPRTSPSPTPVPGWAEADRLVSEQKFAQALEVVSARRAAAQKSGDEPDWARGLIRETQLETALHGYETAVRHLREQPWPKTLRHRAALELFYAQSLTNYARMYSWEIRQRERIESTGAVDLKAWTAEQIGDEASRAYLRLWAEREALGTIGVPDLAEFIQPNDYPRGIRDTLRDAVSYFFVQHLADTSGWSPAESNEVFRLDLPALLSDSGGPAGPEDSAFSTHPLARLSGVLADLEAWHRSRGEREGALEARLERDRRLAAGFSEEADRSRIEADLAGRLPAFRDVPWFSMGKAELALLVERPGGGGDLVKARAIAEEGRRAYPDSIGGRRCRSIVEAIELPSYQIETMASDGPDRRSVRVRHKNIARLQFRVFALDFAERLARAKNENEILPESGEALRIAESAKPVADWSVDLPPTPDFQLHSTFVVPRVGRPGLYLITASGVNGPLVAASFFQSDLVLVSRSLSGLPLELQTVSGASGKPLADAEVSLWRGTWNPQKIEKTASVRTDASGFARIPAPDEQQWYSRFLVARRGPHFALARNVWFAGTAPAPPETASLLFTDRSVYRPLQKALWKVIAYRGDRTKGRLSVYPQTPVTVSLVDANNQKVESATVTTNEFGSAAGEFRIPAGRVLGAWRLESSLPGGTAYVRVEEYKRPSFEVTLLESKEPLRLNRPATIRGEARYYFGLPVASGEVRWRVTRTPQYWWWSFYWWRPPSNPQTVAAGRSALQPDGSFTIAFTPAADERVATGDVTWRYQVDADAVDEGGETHSAGRSFRLGLVSVEARLEAPPGFVREREPARLEIVRTDLDGAPRPGRGTWTIHRLEQPAETRLPADEPPSARGERVPAATPGDRLRARWETDFSPQEAMRRWKEGSEVARGEATHGAAGKAELAVPPLPAGAYRLRYRTLDEFGAAFEFPSDFFVAGPRTPVALPVALFVENATVRVGGTARFLATSGLPDQPLLFEKYRAGRLVTRRELTSGRPPSVLDLPVEEADRGGFAVRLVTVRDHQLVSLGASVSVPWDDKELQIAFETFRDRLKPGGRETWTVRVTEGPEGGPRGRAAAAELLAYMYDRSLDVFAPHVPASIASLYPNGTTTDALQAALGEASFFRLRGDFPSVSGVSLPHADSLIFPSGYPIGGPGRRGMVAFEGGIAGGIAAQRISAEAPAPATLAKAAAAPEDKLSAASRPDASAAAPAQLRSNFAETAFWEPQLRAGPDGSASIEFTVPDSVTAWSVWVHALTRDLKGGATRRDARSAKDLMVRPYVPRFFRAGDRAALEVVVDNASEREMSGTVELDVVDPETNASVREAFGLTKENARRPFTAAAGRGTHATFPLSAPARPGLYAIRATAVSGDFSDGELRPVPVLPGRMTLSQSRFVALSGNDRRTMTFSDLAKNDDPTRVDEQLVVTLDAQLFDSVLQALPYLVQYPYECTEQTLNRFVSTGIVSSVFRDNPQLAKMAAELAKRGTRLAPWDAADPNRRMALEETPWLESARGGADPGAPLVRILDPKIAQATRESAIEKLRKAQTPEGGFPWWPGGPPSPYMTVYILHGFANALEFGVDVPKEMVQRAWTYARGAVWSDLNRCMATEGLCPLVTFVNYTLSSYPDPTWYQSAFSESDRRELLAYSFERWKLHSPYLKAQLALTLRRMGRANDAKLVWASVMDSAKTDRDLGTFWAPEDRSWLWYNDTIETQALALRTLMEVDPADARRHGLVQWLFLNKKLNQWKSTRATAEVIASVVRYLKAEGALGIREEASVSVGGRRTAFVFEPDRYTGARNQVVVPGDKLDPARDSTVVVEKPTKGMAFASATWTFSTERLPAEDRGDFFSVSRRYFRREASASGFVLKPLGELPAVALGDEIEVQISLTSKHEAEYVHLRDPRPAGSEPGRQTSGYRWDLGLGRYEEVRDSGQNFFFERLPAGQYTLKYRLRASMAGTFRIAPATVQSMYAPEFHAYSAGNVVEIRSGDGRR